MTPSRLPGSLTALSKNKRMDEEQLAKDKVVTAALALVRAKERNLPHIEDTKRYLYLRDVVVEYELLVRRRLGR